MQGGREGKRSTNIEHVELFEDIAEELFGYELIMRLCFFGSNLLCS